MAGKAFITDIRERLQREARSFPVKGTFLVHDKQVPLNKNGNPYLALVLRDRDGSINAKMWDNVEETERRESFTVGDFVQVECEAQTYRGQPQLKIKKLAKVPGPGPEGLSDFLGSSTRSPQKMLHEVRALVESLGHPGLRGVLLARLDEPAFCEHLSRVPAAKTNHHAHLGGLLEHTLAVMKLADGLCALYPRLDRDLLLAGAFLHDLGKMRELSAEAGFAYTDEGNLIGHLVIGAQMLEDWLAGRDDVEPILKLKLGHMILSHHGRKEFGSPVVPKFPEALALHFLDNLDSKLQSMFEIGEQDRGQRWSSYQHQFEGYLFLGEPDPKPADDPPPAPERQAELTHRPLAELGRRSRPEAPASGELFDAAPEPGSKRRSD